MSQQLRDEPRSYEREVRDTIVKSSLSGVAATVLAVTLCSPAGLGGMIGTSLASGFGFGPESTPADDAYANLPAYPAPLSVQELSDIRGKLAATTASLTLTRAATDDKIDSLREVAGTNHMSIAAAATAQIDSAVSVSHDVVVDAAPIEVMPVVLEGQDSHLEFAQLLLDYTN